LELGIGKNFQISWVWTLKHGQWVFWRWTFKSDFLSQLKNQPASVWRNGLHLHICILWKMLSFLDSYCSLFSSSLLPQEWEATNQSDQRVICHERRVE
jgi:hypothetical protein